MSDTPRRRWLTFSIRDLLMVTMIVALAAGWAMERTRADRLATRFQVATKAAESSQARSVALEQEQAKLQEENRQIRIQDKINTLHLAVERQVAEMLRRKLAESPSSSAPDSNPLKTVNP